METPSRSSRFCSQGRNNSVDLSLCETVNTVYTDLGFVPVFSMAVSRKTLGNDGSGWQSDLGGKWVLPAASFVTRASLEG